MAYFNYDRKRKAIEDITTCYECADMAGIKDALFINFGLLLGIVREGDFLGHDDDVDMAIDGNYCTSDQVETYARYLDEAGMFFARKRMSRRPDTNDITWFTLRMANKRAKFCHWVFMEYQGFYWHTKTGMWLTPAKFDMLKWGWNENTEGLMLGTPAEYLRDKMWIKFKGIKVQIPQNYGSLLDWEYPGWPVPKKGGSSKKQAVCVVDKWKDQRTWRVKLS